MANFSASLVNTITGLPDLTASGGILTAVDNSNYTTNTEVGHAAINFASFKKVLVEAPDGSDYLFSSLGDGDYLITTATMSFGYDFSSIGDGVYKVTLYSVPDWGIAIAYALATGPYVYYSGKIYRCIQNGTGQQPDTSPLYWTEVTDIDTLPAKYRTYERIAIHCDIDECWADAIIQFNCVDLATVCNNLSLCNNASYIKAARLTMYRDAIDQFASNGLWDYAQDTINAAAAVCCCN